MPGPIALAWAARAAGAEIVSGTLTIHLTPNCSLSPRGAAWFFGLICLVSFTIATTLALKGLWPVFPFAGLEMLVLGWALTASLRRRHYSQTITVSDERVAVETRFRNRREQIEFPRHWAQVKLRSADTRLHPSRLTIESHGRSYEVGSFLTDQERKALAARLTRSVGRIAESPALDQGPLA
ncbi:MAG TPA: DUF2244 domain-containing protein [Steroidobacteraceae bacterium]|nr:DUF2244 domain-containing protein [Steroidobacteraceae bacterium]